MIAAYQRWRLLLAAARLEVDSLAHIGGENGTAMYRHAADNVDRCLVLVSSLPNARDLDIRILPAGVGTDLATLRVCSGIRGTRYASVDSVEVRLAALGRMVCREPEIVAALLAEMRVQNEPAFRGVLAEMPSDNETVSDRVRVAWDFQVGGLRRPLEWLPLALVRRSDVPPAPATFDDGTIAGLARAYAEAELEWFRVCAARDREGMRQAGHRCVDTEGALLDVLVPGWREARKRAVEAHEAEKAEKAAAVEEAGPT